MRKTMMMMTAAGVLLAVTAAHAQWTDQRLNDYAVTNELGEVIFLYEGGWWSNSDEFAPWQSFDLNNNLFYDGNGSGQGGWCGFELETPKLITRVRYKGRGGYAFRVSGTRIQGADLPDFSDAVTLHTLYPPPDWDPNQWRDEHFPSPAVFTPYKYVRFIAPNGSSGGNLTGVEFYGADPMPSPAGTPDTPVLTFEDTINWRMNLCWTVDPQTAILCEIERKTAADLDFSPLTFTYATDGEGHFCDLSLVVVQDADYRIRAVNPEDESAWVYAVATARNSTVGTWIGTPGSYNDGDMTGDKAFDGNIMTSFDAPALNADDAWTGMDFGGEVDITGIRFVPRRGLEERMTNGWFEVADNPDFLSPTTLHTVETIPSANVVTEVPLDPPVTARYARYCAPEGGFGNIAEIEFLLNIAPYPPHSLSVVSSDITNAYAVLSWSLHDISSLISSVLVYRATSPLGPFDLMTPEGIDAMQTEWTDTSVVKETFYYYHVRSLWVGPAGPLEGNPGPVVTYIPAERLERDWSDNTQLKPGMTLLGQHYPPYSGNYLMEFLFDGDPGTCPDTSTTDKNPALGVDLGAPHSIAFMRFVARGGHEGRLNGAELRGSNDPDYTNNFTRLATFSGGVAWDYVTLPTVNQEPFRYIFVQRPDGGDFSGNICELELYGWNPATASIFRTPASLSFSCLPPGHVHLTWGDLSTEQDFYRVERSIDGTNWSEIGTPLAPPFVDTAPLIGEQAFYRVTAVRGTPPNEELLPSAPLLAVAYVRGPGTGLTATYFTDYFVGYNPNEALAGTFLEGAPNWETTFAVRPEIPATVANFRIVYTGTLIIPFAGNWTIYASSDDGVRLTLDGVTHINRWVSRAVTTDAVALPLEAGEYPIRIDYYQGGGGKGMRLEWSGGAIARTVIPTSQLIPTPLPPNEDVFVQEGDWFGRTFSTGDSVGRLGFHTLNPDGSVTVAHAESDMNGNTEKYHYAWQDICGDFIFDAKVELDDDPGRTSAKAMLMVRNDLPVGSPFLAACVMANPSFGGFNVKQRFEQDADIADAFAWTGPHINPVYLRIKRKGDTFSFFYRDPSGNDWVPYHTFQDEEGVFLETLYIGMAVSAGVDNSTKMLQEATFSDISLRNPKRGMMLILR